MNQCILVSLVLPVYRRRIRAAFLKAAIIVKISKERVLEIEEEMEDCSIEEIKDELPDFRFALFTNRFLYMSALSSMSDVYRSTGVFNSSPRYVLIR